MRDIIRVCVFGGYVAMGILVAWRSRTSRALQYRRAIDAFLIYTLAVSFAAGLTQHDMWPFSNWPLVAAIQPPVARQTRLVVVDREGQERNVDYRAWQPFVIDELLGWADGRLLQLEPADQDRAADFLVGLVERGAAQAARGDGVGYFNRVWGPLAARAFLLHPRLWDDPRAVPPQPLSGLRFYREKWNLEERLRNPSAVERVIMYEYRRR